MTSPALRRHVSGVCVLLALAILSGRVAIAQTPAPTPAASTPADCHRIADNTERLACYDTTSGRTAGARTERQPEQGSTSATAAAAPVLASKPENTNATATSIIDEKWSFDPASSPYDISFYNANYLLFGRYTTAVNTAPFSPLFAAAGRPDEELNSTEAKFQISFKARLWTTEDRRWGVWAGYTQQAQWQLYNGDESRPFRDTNYMPEVFVSYRPDIDLGGGFRWGLVNAGYNHQSNGRSDVLSRSWDRIFAQVGVERENLVLSAKVWYRLKEDEAEDDNPDITDYYGFGEVGALYRWRGNSFAGALRGNVSTGKGAVQLAWTSRPLFGPLRGYVQFFSGYGESLIDYNWKQTTIGIGITLNDGL